MGETRGRLHKSGTDRKIAGVCGGLGEYFDVDPTLVRVLFVLAAFWHGMSILGYIILWFVMPKADAVRESPRDPSGEGWDSWRGNTGRPERRFRMSYPAGIPIGTRPRRSPFDRQMVLGLLLVLVGLLVLLQNLAPFWRLH